MTARTPAAAAAAADTQENDSRNSKQKLNEDWKNEEPPPSPQKKSILYLRYCNCFLSTYDNVCQRHEKKTGMSFYSSTSLSVSGVLAVVLLSRRISGCTPSPHKPTTLRFGVGGKEYKIRMCIYEGVSVTAQTGERYSRWNWTPTTLQWIFVHCKWDFLS